ncbi:MAG: D-xylose transport system substrate-binding protein [Candidatus Promineifilaceae bacterium]|jgi:D-xylose transport system substrate-binding protein
MRFRHQLAACVSVALSLCGAQRIQGEPAPRALRIGASFTSTQGDAGRWHATFTKALGERGAAGVALSAENDADLQIDQCDYLLRQSIDVLAIMPVSPAALTGIVARAHAAGVPVLAMNTMIPNCEIDLFVGFDLAGSGATQIAALASRPKNDIFILGDTDGRAALTHYRAGLIRATQDLMVRKDGQLLGHAWVADRSVEAADNAVTTAIQKHGPPHILMVSHSSLAAGAIQALMRIGSDDETFVSGIHPDSASFRRILRGQQHSSLLMPYAEAGRRSADLVYRLATRRAIDVKNTQHNGLLEVPVVLLDAVLVTRENAREMISRETLYPDTRLD